MQKVIETAKDMIQQRGYVLCDEDDEKIIGIDENKENIVVFKTLIDKCNVDRIKEITVIMNNINSNHCIIIYSSVTSMAKKIVETSSEKKFELFTYDSLQFNITKHRLVPKHIKLSEIDAKSFKNKYGLNFETIKTDDPVSLFYNFKKGDIIKIIREDDGKQYITYRIVKGH